MSRSTKKAATPSVTNATAASKAPSTASAASSQPTSPRPMSPAHVAPAPAHHPSSATIAGGASGATHASSTAQAASAIAAAAALPVGAVGAKARRLAREEAERAAKQEAEDLISMTSYNQMLKGLLSKEINAREQAQAEAAAVKDQFEQFKRDTLEEGAEKQTKLLAEQATLLRAQAKAEHDAKVESLVAERVKEARSKDAVKYRDLADIQAKLHVEFEDKYAQRFQRVEREKRELSEKLALAVHRLEGMTLEHKTAVAKSTKADGLVRALEHRVMHLEKYRTRLGSFKNIVKHMSCRLFVNSVRLKKALHGVYDSLRMLHEKLTWDHDYDRTSECILPQHELEVWLTKTHALLVKNKERQAAAFQQLFAGTSQQFVHPNTLMTVPAIVDKTKVNGATTTATSATGAAGAATQSGEPEKGKIGAAQRSNSPSKTGAPTNTTAPSSTTPTAPVLASPSPVSSPTSKKRRGPSFSHSGGKGFLGEAADSAAVVEGRKNAVFLKTRNPFQSAGGLSPSSSESGSSASQPSLNFREMLASISEVEIVLRGCLIECLSKAAEWRASSEDFFVRNQELVAEGFGVKEENRRLHQEVKHLSAALGVLEKTLQLREDEKKALREIEAQAPTNLTGTGMPLQQFKTGGAGSAPGTIQHPQKRLLLLSERSSQESSTNHLDRTYQTNSGAEVLDLTATGGQTQQPTEQPKPNQKLSAVDETTLKLIAYHDRNARLAQLDGTSASQIAALSALDLAELTRTRGGPHSHGGMKGPKGFFDHHNAILRSVLVQKQQLDDAKRVEASLRRQLAACKEKLARIQAGNAEAWRGGERMEQEIKDGDEREEREREREEVKDEEAPTSSFQQEEKQPLTSPRTARNHASARGRTGGPSAGRPQQLDLDYGNDASSRTLRATIPFSPPVFPVSPYAPQRPHSSAGLTSTSAGAGANTVASRGATPRGPALTMTVPNIGGGAVTSSPASPYENPRSRAQSAAEVRPSAGGQLLLSSLLSSTQPLTSSMVVPRPSTSSSSYAGTPIYAPLGVALHHPGVYAEKHGSNRKAEKVYGGAIVERPRTSGGAATKAPSGSLTARELRRPRTVNPLLQASLASTSVVAATLVAADAKLHPSLQVTGDVRYDILSPYTAQPLPWERREPRAPSALSLALAHPPEAQQQEKSAMEQRRQRERKAPVPRQTRSRSREDGERRTQEEKQVDPSNLTSSDHTNTLIRDLDNSIHHSPPTSPPHRPGSRPLSGSGGHRTHPKQLGSLASPPPISRTLGEQGTEGTAGTGETERETRTYDDATRQWDKKPSTSTANSASGVPVHTSEIPREIAELLKTPASARVKEVLANTPLPPPQAVTASKKPPIAAPPASSASVSRTSQQYDGFDHTPSVSINPNAKRGQSARRNPLDDEEDYDATEIDFHDA